MLVRLLYCSRAVDASPAAVEPILAQARGQNPGCGITGVLCWGGGVFLQCIEGGRLPVSRLFGEILKDPRHQDVALLHYEEIAERRFGGWTMGMVNLDKVNQNILLKYFETPELDPYAASGKTSLALLDDLVASASICNRT